MKVSYATSSNTTNALFEYSMDMPTSFGAGCCCCCCCCCSGCCSCSSINF